MTKKKVTSMLHIPTKAQLIKQLSPKQKIFVDNLKAEGATFNLVATSGYPRIVNIVRQPRKRYYVYGEGESDYDYESDGYPSFQDTQDMGFWGS